MIKHRWKKRLTLIFLMLVGVIIFLGSTQAGLRFSFFIAQHCVPGMLIAEDLQGKLFGEFKMKQLSYDNKTESTYIKSLTVKWQPLGLLRGKLIFNKIHAQDIDLQLLGESNDIPFKLPSHLIIKNAQLSDISYQSESMKEPIYLNSVKFNMKKSYWRATLDIQKINPDLYIDDISGELHGKIKLMGIYMKNWQLHTLILNNLTGSINNESAMAKGEFSIQKNKINFSNVLLQVGDNQITINGGLDKQWDLSWNINFNKIKQVFPDARGSIISKGSLKGTLEKPQLHAHADINHFAYQDYTMGHITLNAQGSALSHRITGTLRKLNDQADLTIQAKYTPMKWEGTLTQLDYSKNKKSYWQLKFPSHIIITKDKILLDPVRMQAGKQEMCMQWEISDPDNWQSVLSMKHVDTNNFKFLFPKSMRLSSQLDVNAQLSSHDGRPKGSAEITLNPGKIHYLLNGKRKVASFYGAEIKSEVSREGLYGYIEFNVSKSKQLNAEFNFPRYRGKSIPKPSQVIQGYAEVNLSDFVWLDALSPDLENIKGMLHLTFNLDGTLAKPKLQGRLAVKDAKSTLPDLGVTYDHISFEAKAMGTNSIRITGQAHSGEGQINLVGQMEFENMNFNSRFHITGNNFLAVNTSDYKINVSPDITITASPQKIEIQGNVFVPKARVNPTDFRSVLNLSGLVTSIDYDDLEPLENILLMADLQLKLGDDVQLSYLGLKGRVKGTLQIKDLPDQLPSASGEVSVLNGKYNVYDRELEITCGTLFGYRNNDCKLSDSHDTWHHFKKLYKNSGYYEVYSF